MKFRRNSNSTAWLSHPVPPGKSRIPLIIVCGPPAAGKSTYVAERRGPDDLVIDLDQIAAALGNTTAHGWDPRSCLMPALEQRNRLLEAICEQPCQWPRAWLIVCEPVAEWRDWWQKFWGPERIVVIETSAEECWARVCRDPERRRDAGSTLKGIVRWFADYRPRKGDEVIREPGIA